MKKVSIVIPVYNREKVIERTILSVVNQTYDDIEIIIVNDGSQDETHTICSQLRQEDARIKYISIPNSGVSVARNTGIEYATGEYLTFVDSDDYVDPQMVADMVTVMKEGIDLVCCGYKMVDEAGKYLFQNIPLKGESNQHEIYVQIENLQENKCLNSLCNKLFRLNMIKEKSISLDSSISMGEDLQFVLKYLGVMQGGIYSIDKSPYSYTFSPDGLQANFTGEVNLRLGQLEELRQLYCDKSFPLSGFYLEELRTIYTLMLENANSTENMRLICLSTQYKELCETDIKCRGKYKVFLMLLKIKNICLIKLGVRCFQIFKQISGKAYKW